MKVAAISSVETSVTGYQPTTRNIPEERRPQPHCGVSLKFGIINLFLIINFIRASFTMLSVTVQRLIVGRQLNDDISAFSYSAENEKWLAE